MTNIKQSDDMLKDAVPLQEQAPPKPKNRFRQFIDGVLGILKSYQPPPPAFKD